MNIADKLLMIAENEQRVYEAGKAKGREEGGDTQKAYEEGRAAEKAFWWDELQVKGARVNYDYAFYKFPIRLFYPEYDLITRYSAESMFRNFGKLIGTETESLDLAQRLVDCDVVLDTSRSTFFNYFAYNAGISRFPTISTIGMNDSLRYTFMNSSVETIDKLVLKDDGSQGFINVFNNCTFLKHIIVEGQIGKSIDFSSCPLTVESAVSIIEHLVNLSSNKDSATITFSKHTADLLDENETHISPPNQPTILYGWRSYITDYIYWGLSV